MPDVGIRWWLFWPVDCVNCSVPPATLCDWKHVAGAHPGGQFSATTLEATNCASARSLRQALLQVKACTRGVEVAASVVMLPDNPMTRSVKVHEYAYSIRFTLLPAEEQLRLFPRLQPLASVQLLSRHWVILDGSGQCVDTVEGEAVIGKYPHLTQGAPTMPCGAFGILLRLYTSHAKPDTIKCMMHRDFDTTCSACSRMDWLMLDLLQRILSVPCCLSLTHSA